MKRFVASFLVLILSGQSIQNSIAQEAECREVYTEGIGWTNTFGMGRCSGDSDTDDLAQLAANVLIAAGLLYLITPKKDKSNTWSIDAPRDSIFGKYLNRSKSVEFRFLMLKPEIINFQSNPRAIYRRSDLINNLFELKWDLKL